MYLHMQTCTRTHARTHKHIHARKHALTHAHVPASHRAIQIRSGSLQGATRETRPPTASLVPPALTPSNPSPPEETTGNDARARFQSGNKRFRPVHVGSLCGCGFFVRFCTFLFSFWIFGYHRFSY